MSHSWPMVQLGELLAQYQEYIDVPEPRLYPKLSVKLYGKGVVLDTPTDGSSLRMKRHQLAKSGQVVLSEIWGKKGAIGFVPPEGEGALCTSHFFLFDVRQDRMEPKWLQAIFRANYAQEQLETEAKGTTGYAAVRPKHLLAAKIPLPPLREQRRIVARVEELAAKIEEARSLGEATKRDERQMRLAAFRRLTASATLTRMEEVAPITRRPVKVDVEGIYLELGIRSFGKGTFHKPPLSGMEVGTKKLFYIEPGDLVFNNVFAWEGAVAVAKPEDAGRVGSHRFITCVPKKGVATANFLCFYFLTKEGLEKLGVASPGGAGRNRTLGLEALSDIQVPLLPYEKQLWFDALHAKVDALKHLQAETAAELDAMLPSILDKSFRGDLV